MRLERHYSIGKAAQILGVSKRTLYNWIRQGKIEYVRLPNGHFRIPEKAILKMLYGTREEQVNSR
jgi:excisionase family DNA binding protein